MQDKEEQKFSLVNQTPRKLRSLQSVSQQYLIVHISNIISTKMLIQEHLSITNTDFEYTSMSTLFQTPNGPKKSQKEEEKKDIL